LNFCELKSCVFFKIIELHKIFLVEKIAQMPMNKGVVGVLKIFAIFGSW